MEKTLPDIIRIVNPGEECECIKLDISLSKRGIPCLNESGGAYNHKGSAQIIANKHGNKKRPLIVFSHGYLACNNHAVIPVRTEDLVFLASTSDRKEVEVKVYKIVDLNKEELKATLQHIAWDSKFPDPVFQAAYKSCDYHCRTPYYILQDNN